MEHTASISLTTCLQLVAVALTGLLAGLFYGFDCSVIKGLGYLNDKEYLQAFQSINRAILNPYFFASFMGSVIVLLFATVMCYHAKPPVAFYLLLASTLVYGMGSLGITIVGNVPLNDALDNFDIANASPTALHSMREQFEKLWNRLHHIRTYASIVSFLLATLSLIKR